MTRPVTDVLGWHTDRPPDLTALAISSPRGTLHRMFGSDEELPAHAWPRDEPTDAEEREAA